MSVEKMLDACKTEMELRAFGQAQMKIVNNLLKKNKELVEEVERLKKLVAGAVPIIQPEGSSSPLSVGSDEEEIAKRELRKLKERSMDSDPLMLEEAKKVEIYSKILNQRMNNASKKEERDVKELDSTALLAVLDSNEDIKTN